MKRIYGLIVALLIAGMLFSAPVFAIDDPFEGTGISEGFELFAEGAAAALPFNTTIGLQWSNAHIGQLLRFPPKVGAGVAIGVTTMPLSALQSATDAFNFEGSEGIDFAERLGEAAEFGLPLPGYAIDARAGGLLLPFDVGVKLGYLPEYTGDGWTLDNVLVGADLRYRIIRGRLMLPTISVGVGANYMQGGVSFAGIFGSDIAFDSVELPDYDDPQQTRTYDLALSDPNLRFTWETAVIDFKAQASSNLLLLTPYIGAGLSYAQSTAGGGLTSRISVSEDGVDLTDEQIQQLQEAYDKARSEDPSLPAIDFRGEGGVLTSSTVAGWGTRIYAGTSLNLLILKLDISGMYNLTSGDVGANIGLRIQL